MTRSLLHPAGSEMIPEQWYVIARAARVRRRRRPLRLRRLGRELVLWRDDAGGLHAAAAACPHRGADLGLGRVVGGQLECPYHGFRFAGDGRCTRMPCEGPDAAIPQTMRLGSYEVREAHGLVWLWLGAPRASLPPLPWLEGAPEESATSASHEETWDVAYARVMEGMLDLHHFAFVHGHLFGRALERLEPWQVTVDGAQLHADGTLRDEAGRRRFRIAYTLAFPGLIRFDFGGGVDGVVTTCPVDDEHTFVFARYTQRWLRLPLLGRFLSWLMLQLEFRLVQPDDRRMGLSVRPRVGSLAASHFVRADRAIVEWYKLRARALAPALPPHVEPVAATRAPEAAALARSEEAEAR